MHNLCQMLFAENGVNLKWVNCLFMNLTITYSYLEILEFDWWLKPSSKHEQLLLSLFWGLLLKTLSFLLLLPQEILLFNLVTFVLDLQKLFDLTKKLFDDKWPIFNRGCLPFQCYNATEITSNTINHLNM